ncbi:HTH_Tnp_Tc3_2 domain-containing protein [Trichonephila clavipes]|nr:HTH_Tnp_Tc3_2 domain-containing protein [Trichonephila clavipes]
MGKLPYSDPFNRGEIVGVQCMNYSISEIVTARIFKIKSIPRKPSNRTNCKGQFTLTVHDERGLRHIVHTQQSQLYDGASHTVSKRIVQRSLHCMDFRSPRPTRVPLLDACHWAAHLA